MNHLEIEIDKISPDKISATCRGWAVFPRPGQFMAFKTQVGHHFYAKIMSVKPVEGRPEELSMRLKPMAGAVDTRITQSFIISPQAFYQHQYPVDGSFALPFTLGQVTVDMGLCGRVIYVKPHYNGMHAHVLNSLQAAHVPLVIIDPVGMGLPVPGLQTQTLGQDIRLSIQHIGIGRFVEWVVADFPPSLQSRALELLFALLPPSPEFMGLSYFIHHPQLKNHPFASAILQRLYLFQQNGLIADHIEQTPRWNALLHGPLRVDLSRFGGDMLLYAYEGLLKSLLTAGLPPHTRIVFIAPELVTESLQTALPRFPYDVAIISNLRTPWIRWITDSLEAASEAGEAGVVLSGDWTHHLPVFIADADIHITLPKIEAPSAPSLESAPMRHVPQTTQLPLPPPQESPPTPSLENRLHTALSNHESAATRDIILPNHSLFAKGPPPEPPSEPEQLPVLASQEDHLPMVISPPPEPPAEPAEAPWDVDLSLDEDLVSELGLETTLEASPTFDLPENPPPKIQERIEPTLPPPAPVVERIEEVETLVPEDTPQAVLEPVQDDADPFAFHFEDVPFPDAPALLDTPVEPEHEAKDSAEDPEPFQFEDWPIEKNAALFIEPPAAAPLQTHGEASSAPMEVVDEETLSVLFPHTVRVPQAQPQPQAQTTPIQAGYKTGDAVFHKRYGRGVIQRVMNMEGQQVILNIMFDTAGKRLLDPQLTPLEKVG